MVYIGKLRYPHRVRWYIGLLLTVEKVYESLRTQEDVLVSSLQTCVLLRSGLCSLVSFRNSLAAKELFPRRRILSMFESSHVKFERRRHAVHAGTSREGSIDRKHVPFLNHQMQADTTRNVCVCEKLFFRVWLGIQTYSNR